MLLGVVVLRYRVVDRSGLDVVCFARNILQLPRHRSPRVRENQKDDLLDSRLLNL